MSATRKKTVERLSLFLLADPWQKLCVPLKGMVFPEDRHFLFGCRYLYLLISVVIYLQKFGRRMGGEIILATILNMETDRVTIILAVTMAS